MRTAAILPVKIFSEAKQRLGASLADDLRLRLAKAMVGDVLTALRDCAQIELVIVVTNESSVAGAARYQGAAVLSDAAEAGQSAAVMIGIEHAVAEGFERVLCVPGDCPALDPLELSEVLSDLNAAATARAPNGVLIVPDRHGTGTNALLLHPPDVIEPSFGPGSFERHMALASEAGICCEIARPPTLLLDIDTGEDLQALRDRLGAEQMRGLRTRSVLESLATTAPAVAQWQTSAPAA